MDDFKKRSEDFQLELEKAQIKYGINLYAASVLLQNGEIVTLIKLRDTIPQSKTYDNNTKKGNPIN